MRVAIFTTFSDIQKAYSLNIVTQSQIKMLLLNGYEPTVIVADTFEPEGVYAHPGVTIQKIPNVSVHNEVKKDEEFDQDVQLLTDRLEEILKDQDVILTHDIIYQPACLKHNFAARKVAKKLPKIKWLHWIHSATSPSLVNEVTQVFTDEYPKLIQEEFPNSFYIYPEPYSIPAVARNYNVDESKIRHIPHATDPCEFFERSVEKLVVEKDVLSADAICVYAIRLDTGKQVEYVIKTMAMLKEFGLKVRVIIVDFHSTGGDKPAYRDRLKNVAIDYGLSVDELLWTSEQNEEWEYEISKKELHDLQTIANVFILPSVSETYSLIAQEAMLQGSVVVLNKDFPPFRSIYGDNPIYKKYSSAFDVQADLAEGRREGSWTGTQYGDANLPQEARSSAEKAYHRGTAGQILARLKLPEQAQKTWVRKERNFDVVFKRFYLPIFYEEVKEN